MAETTTVERTHRFALSISGGVALGSYEAGVLSQLYRDLFAFNVHPEIRGKARVTIDAIAGASAGSITGLILAQALALNDPPDELERRMRTCWVDLLEIHHLLQSPPGLPAGDSLFTDAVVQNVIGRVLRVPPDPPVVPGEPLALWITMTNLDGVPFVIDFARKDEYHAQAGTELYALDYKDYVPFLITGAGIQMLEGRMVVDGATGDGQDGSKALWRAAVEAAQASSAFPVAFPSRHQARDLTQYPGYAEFKAAVESGRLAQKSGEEGLQAERPLPERAWFQFVDGGLFNNEPIGRCIDAVTYLNEHYRERDPESRESQGKVGRSFLIIEPDPQLPQDLERALSVAPSTADRAVLPPAVLGKILSAYFNSALYGDFHTAAETNDKIHRLDEALAKLDGLGPNTAALKDEIRAAVGLKGKTEITLQRIPLDLPTSKRLAGAFGGHFGGFLRRDFRDADFMTGQHEARQWLVQWLTLWLDSHAEDIGKNKGEVTEAYTAGLLGVAPPDPATTPVAPTGLTPLQLAASGWFPQADEAENVSEAARKAALTEAERAQIVRLAGARAVTLLENWLHLPPFLCRLALYILTLLLRKRLVREKHSG